MRLFLAQKSWAISKQFFANFQVVCAKCSGAKIALQYAGGKLSRVCKTCKNVLEERSNGSKKNGSASPSSLDEPLERIKGVLDVSFTAVQMLLLPSQLWICEFMDYCMRCSNNSCFTWTGASLCTCSSQWWSKLEIEGEERMDV